MKQSAYPSSLKTLMTVQGITREEVEAKMTAASPSFNATKAEAVKFHDDKSLYTGVYAKVGVGQVWGRYGQVGGASLYRLRCFSTQSTLPAPLLRLSHMVAPPQPTQGPCRWPGIEALPPASPLLT